MLNQETKRKIDSARQILVGKVPDPKAQVEQVTTALIYKFMDDMDRENEELGGKARFFMDDLAEYRWNRLLSKELSGVERLDLYVRALLTLAKAKAIPELFRQIFKDAFLPYRDPETLNLFLKEINSFTYENSENLGNAFEYLLSVLGSQGDAGQFRTPRHIIDFIVEVVEPHKNDKILDPACGTAGFLISSYKHIRRIHSSNYIPEEYVPTFAETDNQDITSVQIQKNGKYKGDLLTPDDKKRLAQNIVGYDISPDMVKLSLVNLYLHGFNSPQISEYDTLTSEERWDEVFDVILANPPFMTPKGGIRPHKKFIVQSKKAEVLFVDYILEHLSPNGRAGVVVPDGIVANPSSAYTKLRKLAIENGLFAVVSLHNAVFKPYAVAKTSILFFDKEFSRRCSKILFIKADNDGYEKGELRRSIELNDLPKAAQLISMFKKDAENCSVDGLEYSIVEKENISDKYNLFVNRYLISNRANGRHTKKRISDIFDVEKGSLQSTKKTEGGYDFITAAEDWSKHNAFTHDCEALVFAHGASGSLGRTHHANGKFIASDLCYIMTPKKDSEFPVNMHFYHAYFNSIREQIVGDLAKGAAKLAINKTDFLNYEIDYFPIELQNEVGEKIMEERKEIDELKEKVMEAEENIKSLIFEIE